MSHSPFRSAAVVCAMTLAFAPALVAQASGATIRERARQEAERKARDAQNPSSVIDGIVTDTLLHPMSVATITVVGTGARVTTGDNGRFRLTDVPAGQYLLIVRRIGFAPTSGIVQVSLGDTLRLAYSLARSVAVMDTVRIREHRVSMRMTEFEHRRLQGVGQFVTQEEIERRASSTQAFDFLRQLSGIEVSRQTDQGAFGAMIALSRREGGSLGMGQTACPMQILLDGIILPSSFDLQLLPPPKQISGIEVYSGPATVPAQFGGNDRRCGLIAVWTRDGS
jgi:hypothetical protein